MKKIYKIILLIIIPLLIAAGISVYSYQRYKSSFFEYYMSQANYKDAEDEVEQYLQFNSTYYDLWYSEDVKNDDGDALFTLGVYRWFDVVVTEDEDENEIVTKTMKYYYVLYNINYGNVYYTLYNRTDKDNRFNGYLPKFTLTLTDKNNDDNTITSSFVASSETGSSDTSFTGHTFSDYNFIGYTDDDGNETKKFYSGDKITTGTDVKWVIGSVSSTYSLNLNLVINATDSKDTSVDEDVYEHDFSDYYVNVKKYLNEDSGIFVSKELNVGYDEDITDAGYAKYVITKYIWWQDLIAIVLTLFITVSTVIVWDSEAKAEAEKAEKIKNKQNN